MEPTEPLWSRRWVKLAGVAVAGLVVVALMVAALNPDPADSPSPSGASSADPAGVTASDPGDDVPSALDDPNNDAFPEPLIDLDHLISGGPPPDGIPPIDQPAFQSAEKVDWLSDTEPVLSLTVAGETRAYPLQIMTWHEIVNDTVGGTPVTVTYCPLCNSGVAFLREVDGRRFDFGTSGFLFADNLVMYDRQTQSLWPQLTGQASVGALTGTQLEAIPMGVVGWSQFRSAHPEAKVLTRDTGHDRDYGRNPYVGYDLPDGGLLVPLPDGPDERLPVKARVIGIRIGDEALAIQRDQVADDGVMTAEVGGKELTVWQVPGQSSALDTEQIPEGQDIGSVAVFRTQVDGRDLTWRRVDDGFVDDQTGSRWSILGQAVTGPLEGTQLDAQRHLDTFWFAWVAFQPDTALTP